MILGSKPFNNLTPEEMQAAIEQLRIEREALRNEAIKEKAIREAKGVSSEPKAQRMPRGPGRPKRNNEADAFAKQMLEYLRSDAKDV